MLYSHKYLKELKCLTSIPRKDLESTSLDAILTVYENHKLEDGEFQPTHVLKLIDDIEKPFKIMMEYRVGDDVYYKLESEENPNVVMYERGEVNPPDLVEKELIAERLQKEALSIKKTRKLDRWLLGSFCVAAALSVALCFVFLGEDSNDNDLPYPQISISNKNAIAHSNVERLYKDASDAIVKIESYNISSVCSCAATGMIISEDGYIISCDHIYEGLEAPKFKIVLGDGTVYNAKFVAGDAEADICVLKITDDVSGLPTVTFGDSEDLEHGQECVVMGFPDSSAVMPVVTSGLVSATSVEINGMDGYVNDYIQTDATANPGNSGGGLFNMKGQVVGIVTSKYTADYYENTVYSIPSTTIVEVVNQLLQYGVVQRISIGISYTMTDNIDADAGIPYGCRLETVVEGGAVDGLVVPGQIIVACNDVAISRTTSLHDILNSDAAPDRNLKFKVYDPEKETYFEVSFEANTRAGTTRYDPTLTITPDAEGGEIVEPEN